MNDKFGLDRRNELFCEFNTKYPNHKPQIIKQAIIQFDCDFVKIDECLRQENLGDFPNLTSNNSQRKISDESGAVPMYSFVSINSANSDSISPIAMSKTYKSSSELSKISSQKSDLQKLDEAFKRLEKHRDFLNMEKLYLGNVIQRRRTESDFPHIDEIENLDLLVNKKYSMSAKSLSYANDLRQPSEMNQRFAGFHGAYNPPINNRPNQIPQFLTQDQLNPNLFHSPVPINDHLAPFKRSEEKRYSAHFDPATDLPQELIGHSPYRAGHHRQRSDPWLVDWQCPMCYTKNSLRRCSFCEYDNGPRNTDSMDNAGS